MYSFLVSANTNRREKKASLDSALAAMAAARNQLLAVRDAGSKGQVLVQRQSEYRVIVEKKLQRAMDASAALRDKLETLDGKWRQSEKDFLGLVRKKEAEQRAKS